MSGETWTPEQEQDFQRVKGDYDALKAQRDRIEAMNEERLTVASKTVASAVGADSENVADSLRLNAYHVRAALAPYDKGPPLAGDTVAPISGVKR